MPFKSGKDWNGNAKGRPKGAGVKTWRGLVADCQRKYGQFVEWQHPEFSCPVSDVHEMAWLQLVSAAQNGERWAVEQILDRGLGKPQQSVLLDADLDVTNLPLDQLTDDLLATIIASGAAPSKSRKGTAAKKASAK